MKYKYILPQLFFLILLLYPFNSIEAKTYNSFGPLTTRNQNPVYLQTINLQPTRATILPEDSLEVRIDSSYSNIFETGSSRTNWYQADMELWRLSLNAIYAFRDDMEASIEIPFILTWGGFLDPFIEEFHKVFGFPNAGRETVPKNQFTFKLYKDADLIYNVNKQKMGLSDITLRVKNRVLKESKYQPGLSWLFDLKLPTGQRSRGLGDGNIDFGFGVALEKSYKRFHTYLDLGYYVSGRDDVLEPYVHQSFFSYVTSFELTLLPTWSIIAQLNGQTPYLCNTGMDEWDGVPLDFTVGFKGEEKALLDGRDLIWQFGFSEDITSSGPSIDFTVFLSIGVRLGYIKGKPYRSFTVGENSR